MALYRFLFAPVLLAVAVIAGSGDHEEAIAPPRPAIADVSADPAPAKAPPAAAASLRPKLDPARAPVASRRPAPRR